MKAVLLTNCGYQVNHAEASTGDAAASVDLGSIQELQDSGD